jgi:diaminopropionate ammonia-lyase
MGQVTLPAMDTSLSDLWLDLWPDYRPTRLLELPALARLTGVGRVFVKVEGDRPLGSFKALGGMIAGLRALAKDAGTTDLRELCSPTSCRVLPRLICASEGNHGLSVATAAKKAGTRSWIYLPADVSEARAARIVASGGEIVRIAGTYDDAVLAAEAAAARGDGLLISDTSSDPEASVVIDVMAGYGLLAQELVKQFRDEARDRPTHLFVQAGVGGLAAAMVEGLQDLLRGPKKFLIVEPESAACVAEALAAGKPMRIDGDLKTSAEMLACGVASAPALRILQRYPVHSLLVSEAELKMAATGLRNVGGPQSTASGAAGLAGLLRTAARPDLRASHQLGPDSIVLLIATEGLQSSP